MALHEHEKHPIHTRLDQHIVSAADDSPSQLAFVAETFRAALSRGCHCVFLHHRTTPAEFAAAVTQGTSDLAQQMSSGQLSMAYAPDVYCAGGKFDPERMVGVVADAIAKGDRDGFEGFCGCGELTWAADGVVGAERLLEYEYGLNELGSLGAATVLCIYDGRTLPASVVKELRRVHPCEHMNGAAKANEAFSLGPDVAASVRLLEELEPPLDQVGCDMLSEIISANADGELSPARQAKLECHFADCPECAQTFTDLNQLKGAVRRLYAPAEAPADFWEAVRSRLH